MKGKQRLSVSVDAEFVAEGQAAVAGGRAESLSAWVNAALRKYTEHGRRMQAMDEWIAAYEAEHGEITEEMMDAADRELRARAIVVNPNARGDDAAGRTRRPA